MFFLFRSRIYWICTFIFLTFIFSTLSFPEDLPEIVNADFAFISYSDKIYAYNKIKKEKILLVFWGEYEKERVLLINEFLEKKISKKDKQKFQTFFINIGDSRSTILEFSEKNSIKEIQIKNNYEATRISNEFNVKTIPLIIIIDKKNKKYHTLKKIEKIIDHIRGGADEPGE